MTNLKNYQKKILTQASGGGYWWYYILFTYFNMV